MLKVTGMKEEKLPALRNLTSYILDREKIPINNQAEWSESYESLKIVFLSFLSLQQLQFVLMSLLLESSPDK